MKGPNNNEMFNQKEENTFSEYQSFNFENYISPNEVVGNDVELFKSDEISDSSAPSMPKKGKKSRKKHNNELSNTSTSTTSTLSTGIGTGVVATTVATTIAATVIIPSVLAPTPTLKLNDFDVFSNSVSIVAYIDNLKDDIDYDLILSNPNEKYVFEEVVEGENNVTFDQLNTYTYYTLSFVNTQENVTYFSKNFYTLNERASSMQLNYTQIDKSDPSATTGIMSVNLLFDNYIRRGDQFNVYLYNGETQVAELINYHGSCAYFDNLDVTLQYTAKYEITDSNGNVLLSGEQPIVDNAPSLQADYEIPYNPNPGEVIQTVNSDGTFNLYPITDFSVTSTTYDRVYQAILLTYNTDYDSPASKDCYVSEDAIIAIHNLSPEYDYGITYKVFGEKDGVAYLLSENTPSGTAICITKDYFYEGVIDKLTKTLSIQCDRTNVISDITVKLTFDNGNKFTATIPFDQITDENMQIPIDCEISDACTLQFITQCTVPELDLQLLESYGITPERTTYTVDMVYDCSPVNTIKYVNHSFINDGQGYLLQANYVQSFTVEAYTLNAYLYAGDELVDSYMDIQLQGGDWDVDLQTLVYYYQFGPIDVTINNGNFRLVTEVVVGDVTQYTVEQPVTYTETNI